MLCKPLLQGRGEPRDPERLKERVGGVVSREWLVYLSSLASIGLCWFLIQNHVIVGWMLAAASAAVVLYILWEDFGRMERFGRDRMLRPEEHTSELQSLLRISYSVSCWHKKQQPLTDLVHSLLSTPRSDLPDLR